MIIEHLVAIALVTAATGQSSNVTYQSTITTGLGYPARLSPAPAGGVYVTDPPAKRVLYYEATGLLPPVTYNVAEGPVGIAVHNDGRVFLSRNDGKIGVYTAGFIFLGLVNPAPRVLTGPNDLAFDLDARELYAVNAGGHQVLVFAESTPNTWTLTRSWGIEGPDLGKFESPQAIALNTTLHQVIVTDADNFRVQVFDTTGLPRFTFGYRTLFTTVTNDGCVRAGAPWACCTGWRTGTCPTSTEIAWFGRSEGVAVYACSNIYVTDALMGTVRVFSSLGKELDPDHLPAIGYGTDPGELRVPCDVMIDGAGKLFIADTNNAAIEVYNVLCTNPVGSGDFDRDGDVDLADFAFFQSCMTGPGGIAATQCAAFDFDPDADVDLFDFQGFVSSWNSAATGAVSGSPQDRETIRQAVDNPAEIVIAMNTGTFREDLDLNRDLVIDADDLELAVARFGAGTVEDFLDAAQVATPPHDALVPPHILDIANRCGRCHSMTGAPEGGMLTASGQENLCQSCHSAGKIAGSASIGAGSLENSHPWGVPTDDMNLDPQSELALHLDNGNVRCGTCHDPHENRPKGTCVADNTSCTGAGVPWSCCTGVSTGTCKGCAGGPFDNSVCVTDADCGPRVQFLREEIYHGVDHRASQGGTPAVYARKRMTVMDPTLLCAECHSDIAAQWSIVGHGEHEADPWSHYDWSLGNNWLCTGPGTPYGYCTGEGAGTVSSPALALCTGPSTPLACCTGAGTGTCAINNASCTGIQTPWQCCLGAGTGNCIANTACTNAGIPSLCCTGAGTGTCSNSLPAVMCTGAGAPEPCCASAGAGSCSSREVCRQCHSGNGYIDWSKDFPDGTVVSSTHRGALRNIDCLVCHATHGRPQDGKLLRIYDTIRFPTGQVFTGVGPGATCMSCHNGRSLPPNNPTGVSTPHYLNGGAMLEGINAVNTFPTGPGAITYALTNSNHTTNTGLNCTTCHMAPGPTSGPEMGKVGEHTFRLKDHDTGFENVSACNAAGCHDGAPLDSFDRIVPSPPYPANRDYDGDGTIEGVQTEVAGLFDLLKDALYVAGASRLLVNPNTGLAGTEAGVCTGVGAPWACCTGVRTGPTCADPDAEPTNPYWTLRRCAGGTRNGLACNSATPTAPFDCPGGGTCPQIVPTGNRTSTVVNGIWNWEFVDNSGDHGVKNTGYAVGVLQIAYKGVSGVPVPAAAYRYSPAP